MTKQIQKREYKINASERVLGRLASEIAVVLREKNSAKFLPYVMPKNEVIVFNTDKIKVTGKKMKQKVYRHHTGYPGGLKEENLRKLFGRDSRQVLWRAVYGMLPKNRTRDKIIKNLKLYKGEVEK
jgi:large subunit ribosomal protein L13